MEKFSSTLLKIEIWLTIIVFLIKQYPQYPLAAIEAITF
jgi:hypothetical protein